MLYELWRVMLLRGFLTNDLKVMTQATKLASRYGYKKKEISKIIYGMSSLIGAVETERWATTGTEQRVGAGEMLRRFPNLLQPDFPHTS